MEPWLVQCTPYICTDRICVVVFGTWWVNSGNEFRPEDVAPVGPGGHVKRTARTPHYDGVPRGQHDPAVIAIFGLGPVDIPDGRPDTAFMAASMTTIGLCARRPTVMRCGARLRSDSCGFGCAWPSRALFDKRCLLDVSQAVLDAPTTPRQACR